MDSSLIFKYFQDLSDLQKEQLSQLGELYLDWNQKNQRDLSKGYGFFL